MVYAYMRTITNRVTKTIGPLRIIAPQRVGKMSDFIMVPTFNHLLEVIGAGTFSSADFPMGVQLADWLNGV